MVKSEDPLSLTFAALADPIRRDLLERLARGPASISDLAGPHALSLPGMLKHVRVLENAGLLQTAKDGRVRRCGLTPRPMQQASRWLDRTRAHWERKLDSLDAFLKRTKGET